jgi:NADH-quinone oxidoreductase subunit N
MIVELLSQTNGGSSGCTIAPGGTSVSGLCTEPNTLHIPVAYSSILPVLILSIGALLLLTVSAVLPKRSRPGLFPLLTLAVGAASLAGSIWQWYNVPTGGGAVTIGGQVLFDRFAVFFSILISIAVMLSAIAADSYLRREGLDGVESYVLMLMSATGAVLMAESAGLILMFLGLEIMSIALYVMSAYHRRRVQSGEAGLKYFLLGSFSSALFLYGIALIYGATGTVNLVYVSQFLATNVLVNNGVLLAGMVLLIVGLGFKVAAVPFHFWTPDVYQGAPTPFTGYMAAVAKAAGFAGLLRVLMVGLPSQRADWRPIIWMLALLTLVVGSVLAIASRDLKRMLAYSSISQAGYVLVAVQAGTSMGTSAALFYLFTYAFIVIGSFAIIDVIEGPGERRSDLGTMRGLSRRQPLVAAAMLVLLLAQAGVPFTSGFLGKFYVIQASVQEGQYYLAIIAMIAAAVAAFFYLRVALLMYASDAAHSVEGETDVFGAGLAPVPVLDGPPVGGNGAVGSRRSAMSGAPGSGAAAGSGAALPSAAAGSGPALSSAVSRPAADVVVLDAPPATASFVPSGTALVVAVSVAFTIAAGVSSFALDFAKAATSLF